MDVDGITDDWILVSAPTPKKRSAPKAIPTPVCRRATSLEQPLKRGGRPAPEFFRPVSLTTPPMPTARQWGPELTVDAPVQIHKIAVNLSLLDMSQHHVDAKQVH